MASPVASAAALSGTSPPAAPQLPAKPRNAQQRRQVAFRHALVRAVMQLHSEFLDFLRSQPRDGTASTDTTPGAEPGGAAAAAPSPQGPSVGGSGAAGAAGDGRGGGMTRATRAARRATARLGNEGGAEAAGAVTVGTGAQPLHGGADFDVLQVAWLHLVHQRLLHGLHHLLGIM